MINLTAIMIITTADPAIKPIACFLVLAILGSPHSSNDKLIGSSNSSPEKSMLVVGV